MEAASGGTRPLVLVAEEDAEHEAVLTPLLDVAGFSPIAAWSGDDALALAQSRSPSLVILDVALAGKSGYEVCRALREEFGDELPIGPYKVTDAVMKSSVRNRTLIAMARVRSRKR